MTYHKIAILEKALAREKAAREKAELILEEQSEQLNKVNKQLESFYAQLQLEYSKKTSQLQGVFETIIDAYVITDLFGNLLKMNSSAVNLLGFETTKDDFNIIDLVPPNDRYVILKAFKKLLKTGSITDLKVSVTTKNNKRKLLHLNASVIYEDDIPVAVQGILRDITIQNLYHKSIESERLKFSNIITNMNLGLMETDLNDQIVFVNQRLLQMSGYTQDDLIGNQADAIFPWPEGFNVVDKQDSILKRSNLFETQVTTKDGESKCWLVSGAPNYNIDGEIIGSISIKFDISMLKELEKQKEVLLNKLEKSNQELYEYAHVVSHDLKSPLRSIDALVNWIKEDNSGVFSEETNKNFHLIESTLERMELMITDILHYSSTNSSNQKRNKVDTNDLLKEIKDILYVPEHIELIIPKKMPVIYGDYIKIQQVFQNLISNAIKFNDKPKGYIKIGFTELSNFYEFFVEDNGIGIEEDYHDNIFKIFHVLNKNKDSTGIGLSIVKKIVELHGGEIWLESKLNYGTTFYFTMRKRL